MSDPVLTSSFCTNWGAFNTPRLWSMVMNEEDGLAREQVHGWRRLAGSIRGQHQALAAAKADLIAAWPPEENASAEAFLNELDRLMARLEVASTDADTTANGLDKILNALDTAKKSIEPLWERYKDKSDDLVPRWFDSAEDEIDEQARAVMIKMEGAVADAVAELRVPDPYNFTVGEGPQEWPPGSGNGPGSGSGAGRLGSGGVSPSVPHEPPPPLPGQDPIVPDGPSGPGAGAVVRPGGPDLAGVINPLAPPPAPVGGAPGPAPVGTPPPPVGGVPPLLPGVLPGGGGAGPGVLPSGRGPAPGAGIGRPPVSGAGRGPGPGRPLPSGAVIGGLGTGAIAGPGATSGRGVAGPGATSGRGIAGPGATGGRGVGSRPGRGGVQSETGRAGGVGRGAGGPQLGGVGGPAGRGLGGVRGPGAGRGRSGGRDGDEVGGIRPGAGDVEAFGTAPAGTAGPIGGPLGVSGSRAGVGSIGGLSGSAGGRPGVGVGGPASGRFGGVGRGAATPAPRPAWLPDDPVGPDRHNVASGARPGSDGRSRWGDEPTGFDPDSLWQVAEGVSPVISPGPDDDRHDPGPGVIGRRG